MTLSRASRFAVTLALACLVSGVLLPASVAAFEEEQQEDPSDCIALWDPFCPGTPGGGPTILGCYDCAWIPEGPNGEAGGYLCVKDSSGYGKTGCIAWGNGCSFQGQCLLV